MTVNNFAPSNNDVLEREPIRASCVRCSHVGAWDGIHTYYWCPTAKAMGKALNNLRNLSVYLTAGKS